MEKQREIAAKILYGLLFSAGLPLALILWAAGTDKLITLPVPPFKYPGYILLVVGIIIASAGVIHLWIHGRGLPMSPFPPKKLVTKGIYAFSKHPIYLGSALICPGVSIIFHSSSGLWLVSPLFVIMIWAWITGFENERTGKLFPDQNYRTFLSLPLQEDSSPSTGERIASYLLAFIPWIIVYESFILAGKPENPLVTNLWFEKNIPVFEQTEIIYAFTYILVLMIPVVIRTRSELRRFITDVWFSLIIVGLFYFVFPMIVHQREFIPQSLMGRLIMFERSVDGEVCALPSYHVIWAFLAARYCTTAFSHSSWIWYTIAVLISISCVTTGHHSIPDVLAGFIFYLAIRYRSELWNNIRRQSEKLANSWKEWRIGPLRIINHGFYGGAAGLVGTLIAGFFLGPHLAPAGFVIMLFVIIGAGLWAQLIEGSPKLLRPYGYYGGVAGVLLGCTIASLAFKTSIVSLMAAFAMAGPWIQAIGRLRCLVQGCCHGRPCNENTGIRFTHPNSRVNKISGLNGVPVHPTQLYSIGCNMISGLILFRLYTMGMPAIFITGIYFILNGLGRFVEEALRGEAQTPYWAGMRIYQWIAILNILLGAILTTIPDSHTLTLQFNIQSLFLALPMGLIVMFASGVDFPESDRRFARLTSN